MVCSFVNEMLKKKLFRLIYKKYLKIKITD